MVRVLFPGSFDPITLGHLDLIQRSLDLFESVTVGVGANVSKNSVFTPEERVALIREVLPDSSRVDVRLIAGLVVDAAREWGMGAIVRGLRSPQDFAAENQLAQMNRQLAPTLDTVFLVTAPEFAFVSSSLIKDIARHRGDVAKFVSPSIALALAQRIAST